MKSTFDHAKWYLEMALGVIPLRPKDKLPSLSQWKQYQTRRATEEEIDSWFKGTDNNIGIVCGKVSGNLVVVDFDDERAFRYCFSQGDGLAEKTLCVRTSKGIHVYLRLEETTKKTTLRAVGAGGKAKPSLPVDIQGEGGYVVAPPSIHLSGKRYEFINEVNEIALISADQWTRFNERMRDRAEEWPIVERLLPAWNEGSRQNLTLGVSAFLRKVAGFNEDRVTRVMKGICEAAGDSEIGQRTSAVHATFSKEVSDIAITDWLGDDLFGALKKVAPANRHRRVDEQTSPTKGAEVVLWMSGTEYVTWTPEEARLGRKTTVGDGDSRIVIIKPPRPKRRLIIDDDTFYETEDDGKTKTSTVSQLHQELAEQGRITLRSRSMDVLSVIISRMTKETYEGHATYGVYSEAGKLAICERPHPMKAEQRKVQRQIQSCIPFVPNQDDIQAYVDFLRFFHPHEILHKLGQALTVPYNPIIKVAGILVPAEMSVGPHDAGKSKSSEAVSQKAYGIVPVSGASIGTEFKFLSQLDSVNLPRAVNEAEKIDPKLWPLYKDSCESYIAGQRGTKDLDMLDYNSRLGPMHSCNELPLVGLEEVLKRFWVTRFTEQDRVKRSTRSKEFKEAFRKLRPIGFQLQRWWVEAHQDEEELLRIIYDHEKEISDEYEKQGYTWMSPQRAQGWACAYLGLQIFELGCRKVGVDWHVPTIEKFVDKVVAIIEEMTWSRTRSSVSLFASWLAMFKAMNRRPVRGRETVLDERGHAVSTSEIEYVTPGEDELWCEREVSVEGRGAIAGTWVTVPIVDRYNKENKDGHKYTLTDLGREAADKAGIPYDLVLDMEEGRKSWKAKSVRIGEQARRAAFIPACLDEGWQIQTRPDEFKSDGADEWSDLIAQDVTQSYPKSPTRVTEKNTDLGNVSDEQRNPVTRDAVAHTGDMSKKSPSAPPSHESTEKSGLQGNNEAFSSVWPSVTPEGNSGLQRVTKSDAVSSTQVTKSGGQP
jgi:hypothetical protein